MVFGKNPNHHQQHRVDKHSVEYQIVKEMGHSWRNSIDIIIYEYMVMSKKHGMDADEYRAIIEKFAKSLYVDCFVYRLTTSALIDTIKKFQVFTEDMHLDDHYTFTVALEGMENILNPKSLLQQR